MTDRDLIQRALGFIADLNGSRWIPGKDTGAIDMRQRALSLHQQLYDRMYRSKTK